MRLASVFLKQDVCGLKVAGTLVQLVSEGKSSPLDILQRLCIRTNHERRRRRGLLASL